VARPHLVQSRLDPTLQCNRSSKYEIVRPDSGESLRLLPLLAQNLACEVHCESSCVSCFLAVYGSLAFGCLWTLYGSWLRVLDLSASGGKFYQYFPGDRHSGAQRHAAIHGSSNLQQWLYGECHLLRDLGIVEFDSRKYWEHRLSDGSGQSVMLPLQ